MRTCCAPARMHTLVRVVEARARARPCTPTTDLKAPPLVLLAHAPAVMAWELRSAAP